MQPFSIFDSRRTASFLQYLLRKRYALLRVSDYMSDRRLIDSTPRGHLDLLNAHAACDLKMHSGGMLNHVVQYFSAYLQLPSRLEGFDNA